MHRTTAALFASLVIATAACAQSRFARYEPVEVGDLLPNISLPDTEGVTRTLDALRNQKPTLLFIWSPMGPNNTNNDIDALRTLDAEYDGRATVITIAASHMDRESIIGAVERLDMPFDVLIDDNFRTLSLFESGATNSLTLLDADGIVVSRFLDSDSDRFDTARTHLDALLAGEPLPDPVRPGARDENAAVRALNLVTVDRRNYSGVASKDFGARVALTMTDGNAEILTPEGATVAAPKRARIPFYGGTHAVVLEESDGHLRIAGPVDFRDTIAIYSLSDRGHLIAGVDGLGINTITSADLDNDGNDEFLVAHDGITAFSGESVLWKQDAIRLARSLDASDISGDPTPEIVVPAMRSGILVLDNTGERKHSVRLPISPNTVRAMPRQQGEDAHVFVMDSGHNNANGHRLGVVDLAGKSLWRRAV
ncbi:MAG: redoxin domain-containing protein [Planctomycetota bacterium]